MFGFGNQTKVIGRAGDHLEDHPFGYFDHHVCAGYSRDLALAAESDPGAMYSEVANAGAWLVTVVDGGGDDLEEIRIADDEHGGVLEIITNDADNDVMSLQLNGEAFALGAGRQMEFYMKIKVDDVSTADWFVGLAVADTDILGGVTDSLGFRVPDASGNIEIVIEKDSVETTQDTTVDMEDDVYVLVCFRVYDGGDRIDMFINGLLPLRFQQDANAPDNEAMTPTIEIRNASAAASTMSIDYSWWRSET